MQLASSLILAATKFGKKCWGHVVGVKVAI